MSDGFLGRWSKRKLEVKQGRAVADEPAAAAPAPPSRPAGGGEANAELPAPAALDDRAGGIADEAPPPPTMEDVQLLTAQSDFTRFVARDVTPEVRNAAMKKLFADPRYNVMDGLDVYTGDYSQPDPMPASMLQALASAKFLRLFDEPPEGPGEPRDVADNPTGETVAQCEPAPPAVPEPPQDADPDLRLQQDHAPPGEDPGRGTG